MKKTLKRIRPFDYTLIIVALVLSFSPFFFIQMTQNTDASQQLYAVISINGEEVDRFLLTGNEEHQLITYYPAPNQYNIVEIDGERIRNKEDNSPQQIAVRMDWIQYPGQTSLNIPHRFLIEIISDSPEELEVDIIT